MPVETLLPVDLCMDLIVLACAQAALGRIRIKRLLAAVSLMGLFTCAVLLTAPPPALRLICAAAVSYFAAAILTHSMHPKRALPACFSILTTAFAAAGLSALFPSPPAQPFAAACGAILAGLLIRSRRHIYTNWNINVYVEVCGLHTQFPALIDTGNRLREGRSGLPVLIVEAARIPELAQAVWLMRADAIRHVDYNVLGAAGRCPCFKPDDLKVITGDAQAVPAPECFVAVYPGKIPGRFCALAPGEFANLSGI